MASKIVRTVDIQYTAKGLEEIAAQAKKISLFPVDSDNINEIQKRITSMQSILTSEGTIVSPELAEEIGKEYKAILDLLAKARLDLIGLEDKEAASSLDNVEAALSLIDDKIEKQEDRIEKMKISESDGWFTAEGKGFSKEVTQQASKQALTEGETMRGISGREIKNADSFLESMQKADEAMKSMNGVQTEIAEKLKAGKDLTKTELILVQEHLNTQENIKLNAEELSQQYKYRNSIIGQEQIILKDIYNTTVETAQTEIKKLQEQKTGLEEIRQLIESGVSDIKIISPEQQKILDLINETLVITNKRIAEYKGKIKEAKKEQRESEKAIGDATDKTKKQGDTLGKAANQVFNYGIAFTALRRIYRETLRTITELDKAFTEMAIVTTMNREQTWELSNTMFDLAKQTGFTATEIAKLSTQYFRQGRSLQDVLILTEVTAKAARIAGISTAESVTYLTSAVNGFGLAADQALAVSDRFAALAASSATSYEELANGLSKFAAQANVAGVSIDFAMGMLAKGVETTREAPETIGTAIKTILARMRELTDYGKTLEEGMDVNRVERALKQVGIQLRDANGQFRDMEQVLTEVGKGWDNLNTNQRAAIAVSLAGTRQQSRLIAIMADFDRTLELINISQESAGATNAQQVEFMQGLEAATIGLQTAYQEFIKTISDSDIIIGIVKILTTVIESLTGALKFFGVEAGVAMGLIGGFFIILKLIPILKSFIAWTKGAAAAQATFNTVAAVNPYVLIATALAGVVIGIGYLVTATDRSAKALKRQSDEVAAASYEFNKLNKDIKSAMDTIAELNKLPFFSDEQQKQLDDALEKIAELVGEENVVRIDGVVNLELSQAGINKFLEKEAADLKQKTTDNFENAFYEGLKFNYYGKAGEVFQETKDPVVIKSISDYMIMQFRESFDNKNRKLTGTVEKLYREFIAETLSTNVGGIMQGSSGRNPISSVVDNFIAGNMLDDIEFLEKAISSIESNSKEFSKYYDSYIENLSKGSDIQKQILNSQYKEFDILTTKYGSSATNLILQLEKIGVTDFTQIAIAVRDFGDELPEVLEGLNNRIKEIMGSDSTITEQTATSMAFAELSRTIGNAELRLWAYEQAFRKTSQFVAQGIDTLNSGFKNMIDTQDKFLKGELSKSDLYDFIQENVDLFETLEQVEAFLSGGDITLARNDQAIQLRQDSVNRLTDAYVRFYAAGNEGEKASALRDIVLFRALLQYNGVLKQTSIEQQNFNNVLKQYNLLTKFGIENAQLNTQVLSAQVKFINSTANSAGQNIQNIQENFQNLLGAEGINKPFSDFIQIVNGTAIPIFENLNGLTTEFYKGLETALSDIQKELDTVFNAFEEIRKENLRQEKETLDAQRKVYEDYFSALDRLESERERRLNRRNLVEQLSRLEGATDERSRKRALDIRKDLNKLDEESAKTTQEQSREALLNSFDERYEELEKRWALAGEQFIDAMSEGGTEAAGAFKAAMAAQGLLPGITDDFDFKAFATSLETFADTIIEDIEDESRTQAFILLASKIDGVLEKIADPNLSTEEREFYNKEYMSLKAQETYLWEIRNKMLGIIPSSGGSSGGGGMGLNFADATLMPYSKGGLVDFTGAAMLHGSSTSPEAVLNPQQTQMFMGLRDALQGLSFDGAANATVNIENIEIKTDSLNNNQDFNRAGETLANAFNNAIQRRGLMINTKK